MKELGKNHIGFFACAIDGIVLFTNNRMELSRNNETVPILKIGELYDYILNKKEIKLSQQELKTY